MTTYTLPARFALKGSNNKFLKDVPHKGHKCLQFSASDYTDDVQAVFLAEEVDGYYGIKSEYLGKFLKRRDDNWVVADSPDCTDNNTQFWALLVHGNKITLHNAGNEATCGMLTADASNAWLNGSGHTPVFEVIDLSP